MNYILGINAFHGDSSACILNDGVLIAAAEEERFRRIKHWAGFPSESIKWCLTEAGINLDKVQHVAINQNLKANIIKKIIFVLGNSPSFKMLQEGFQNKRKRLGIKDYLLKEFPDSEFKGLVHSIEHHSAHLSSAFHVSPFGEAVVVSVDGFGDFASSAWGVGKGIKINVEDRIYFPHSLGLFYEASTQLIGFEDYGEEYKFMGLAGYGKPIYYELIHKTIISKSPFKINIDCFNLP